MSQIELNEYQIANLRQGLVMLDAIGADTGDWLHEILHLLPDVEVPPNKTIQEQRADLAARVGFRLLFSK